MKLHQYASVKRLKAERKRKGRKEKISKQMDEAVVVVVYILISRSGVTAFLFNLLPVSKFLPSFISKSAPAPTASPRSPILRSPSLSPSGSLKPKFKLKSVPPPSFSEPRVLSEAWIIRYRIMELNWILVIYLFEKKLGKNR